MKRLLLLLLLLPSLAGAQSLKFTDPIFRGATGITVSGVVGTFVRPNEGTIAMSVKIEDDKMIYIETWIMYEEDCGKTIRPYGHADWTDNKLTRGKAIAGTRTMSDTLTKFLCALAKDPRSHQS